VLPPTVNRAGDAGAAGDATRMVIVPSPLFEIVMERTAKGAAVSVQRAAQRYSETGARAPWES
jgi:hypothetical protein